MKYKKKKGSTLLVVVCLCAFLSILTLSIMLVTTGGFKLRKDENTRVENFYSADSGVEIAKNKIVEVIEDAINSGETVINGIIEKPKDFPWIDFSEEGWEQKPFKVEFERYIKENLEKEIDNVQIRDGLGELPTTVIYDEFKRDEIVVKVDATEGKVYQDGAEETESNSDYSPTGKRHQEWELTSNFTDKNNKSREVEVTYNIKTPNYGKVSGQAVPNMNIFDYIMGIDGNLDINNNGTFSAIGHMWIGGDNQSGNRDFDLVSYKPGIKLHANAGTTGANLKWDGNVTTPKDIFIEDANFQADSLYVDDFLYKGENHSLIFNKDILVHNDFIFDAEATKLTAQNYYGLDDVDEKQLPREEDMGTSSENWGRSSSIIVNSSDFGAGSELDFKKDAYVLGTAYLQLKGADYKTGESIAINKMADPYTRKRLEKENIDEGEYLYKYISPLHIIDKKIIGNELFDLAIYEKSDLVEEYLGTETLDTIFGGMKIGGNSYSSGILYDDQKLVKANGVYPSCSDTGHDHKSPTPTVVECKIKEFSEEAYNMGGSLRENEVKYSFENKETQVSVDESFNWKFIRDNMMTQEELKKDDGTVILNRTDYYPRVADTPKDITIFESTMTVKEIVGAENLIVGKPGSLAENYFLDSTVTIIFNSSERDLNGEPKNPKEIHFKEGIDGIKEVSDNEIQLPLKYINDTKNLTIVISDGDINIIQPFGASWQVRGMFYSSENLNLGVGATMTFGNFSVPRFHDINDIFKKLFGGVIGGVVEGGIIDQGNGEEVINPPDLLEQEEWNLIK